MVLKTGLLGFVVTALGLLRTVGLKPSPYGLGIWCFCLHKPSCIVTIKSSRPFLILWIYAFRSENNTQSLWSITRVIRHFPIQINYTPPRFNEVERGYTGCTLSVRPSVCGQNRVRSVSSTILIGSFSYLHILSSNFRRFVACNVCFKIQTFEILVNSLNL